MQYGSTDDAAAYFEDLGFERPPRWTTADFLTSVTDEHERRVKEGWEDKIPKTPEEFDRKFKGSDAEKKVSCFPYSVVSDGRVSRWYDALECQRLPPAVCSRASRL